MEPIYTVFGLTPILGASVALLTFQTPMRNSGILTQFVGGAITGGAVGATVEYTVNSQAHSTGTKWSIITGAAYTGGTSAVVAGFMSR